MNGPVPFDPIRPIQGPESGTKPSANPASEKAGGPSFADILKDSIQEVNELKNDADSAIQELALGKTENVSEVLTAVEKADLAFRALMSIRNKLVDAYEEVNRLRV